MLLVDVINNKVHEGVGHSPRTKKRLSQYRTSGRKEKKNKERH